MSGPISNKFYSPALLKQLQTTFMLLAPLWSKLIIGDKRLPSNAAVESYFKTIKTNLLKSRTGLVAGDFIRLVLQDLSARVKDDVMAEKLKGAKVNGKATKTEKKRGREKEVNGMSPDRAKERWGPKRARRDAHKRSYRDRDIPDILKVTVSSTSQRKESGQSKEQAGLRQNLGQGRSENERKVKAEGSRQVPDRRQGDFDVQKKEERQQKSPFGDSKEKRGGNNESKRDQVLEIGNILVNHHSWETLSTNTWLDDCILDASLLSSSYAATEETATFSVHCMEQIHRLPITRWMTGGPE